VPPLKNSLFKFSALLFRPFPRARARNGQAS
jgi:hypothetical protein